jgi:hypothetical protein
LAIQNNFSFACRGKIGSVLIRLDTRTGSIWRQTGF